jgi:hypothetical protein
MSSKIQRYRSDEDIAKDWAAFQYAAEGSETFESKFWAYRTLDKLRVEEPERSWLIVNKILEIDDSDLILMGLAAGPLEDLLVTHGSDFIERIESVAKSDLRFRKMLKMVWRNNISEAVWKRVQRIVAGDA